MIKLQDNICAVIFLFIFIMCLLQIFFRNIIYFPAPWTEEFARVGLIYLTFIGASVGLRTKAHPSVDFLTSKLPLRARMVVALIAEILVGWVSYVFLVYGWKFTMWMVNDHSTTYYYSKSTWYYSIAPAGALMLIYGIRNIVYIVKSIIKNEDLLKEADKYE